MTVEITISRHIVTVMLDHGSSCLPTLNDRGHCVGIVTQRDVPRSAFMARAAAAYVASGTHAT